MNRSKYAEFFDADLMVKGQVNVIGCGAVGGYTALGLVQLGCTNIHIWDDDTVCSHNPGNQIYGDADIGKYKVDALEAMLLHKNPDAKIVKHKQKLQAPYVVNGYIFLCVDNIETRRAIVEANRYNPNAIAFFDFRMRLTDAQHYFAARDNCEQVEALLGQMQFSHEEAAEATPRSACNIELNVCYTVWNIVSLGLSNFQKFCVDRSKANTIVLSDMEEDALVVI